MKFVLGRSMNVVLLLGRMGNQLFQYSFAAWLQRTTGLPTYFDASLVGKEGVTGPQMLRQAIEARVLWGSARLPVIAGRLDQSARFIRKSIGPTRIEVDLSTRGRLRTSVDKPAWWVGYWQREEYARAASGEIARLMSLDSRSENGCQLESAEPGMEVVRVHVRRGDYVGTSNELPNRWYRMALESVLGDHGHRSVEVVSDDPQWCMQNLNLGVPFAVVGGRSSHHDFQLLAQADTLIASASTFAWWAGYLGGRRVLYPNVAGEVGEVFSQVRRKNWHGL